MRTTASFSRYIENIIRNTGYATNNHLVTEGSYNENNSIGSVNVIIKRLYDNVYAVPNMQGELDSFVRIGNPDYTVPSPQFVVPLVSLPNYDIIKKTADSILDNIFRSGFLLKVDTTKGYVYYGSGGIVLDGDYKPLLIIAHKFEAVERLLLSPICFVSNRVFSREDIISRHIVKKIIPYLSIKSSITGPNIDVIIGDIDNMIYRPEEPLTTNVTDSAYRILSRNLNEVL